MNAHPGRFTCLEQFLVLGSGATGELFPSGCCSLSQVYSTIFVVFFILRPEVSDESLIVLS